MRSSSTVSASPAAAFHSRTTPAFVALPRSSSTACGAGPDAAKTTADGPAVRPAALRSCTLYASIRAGADVNSAANGSTAPEAPGFTCTRCTTGEHGVDTAFFLSLGAEFCPALIDADGTEAGVSRHISATIGPAIGILSVVREGVVHCSLTSSPTRLAVSPVTISGSFSDGGCGGPGLAHPLSRANVNATPAVAIRPAYSTELLVPNPLMCQKPSHQRLSHFTIGWSGEPRKSNHLCTPLRLAVLWMQLISTHANTCERT